jgi:hypothetical protein
MVLMAGTYRISQHVFLFGLAVGVPAFQSGHLFGYWCWNRFFVDHLMRHAQLAGRGREYAIGEMVQKEYDTS